MAWGAFVDARSCCDRILPLAFYCQQQKHNTCLIWEERIKQKQETSAAENQKTLHQTSDIAASSITIGKTWKSHMQDSFQNFLVQENWKQGIWPQRPRYFAATVAVHRRGGGVTSVGERPGGDREGASKGLASPKTWSATSCACVQRHACTHKHKNWTLKYICEQTQNFEQDSCSDAFTSMMTGDFNCAYDLALGAKKPTTEEMKYSACSRGSKNFQLPACLVT